MKRRLIADAPAAHLQASVFVLSSSDVSICAEQMLQHLRRQYLYFCTGKASQLSNTLSTCDVNAITSEAEPFWPP
jgi:hypothetical protein